MCKVSNSVNFPEDVSIIFNKILLRKPNTKYSQEDFEKAYTCGRKYFDTDKDFSEFLKIPARTFAEKK